MSARLLRDNHDIVPVKCTTHAKKKGKKKDQAFYFERTSSAISNNVQNISPIFLGVQLLDTPTVAKLLEKADETTRFHCLRAIIEIVNSSIKESGLSSIRSEIRSAPNSRHIMKLATLVPEHDIWLGLGWLSERLRWTVYHLCVLFCAL